ncbi:MAG: hypothetical protein ACLUE8_01350 [Lachnospiraceae bacterium]
MSAFECWEEQRESLRAALKDQTSVADQVYAIRHALMQTEQNTLAQQSDEVLRQQMGVLFSLVKGSVGFLETPVAATSWVAQSRKTEKQGGKAWLVVLTALLMIFSGLCCYFRGIVLGWVSALAALIAGSAALLTERRKSRKATGHDEVRVTLQPDVERLLAVLDGQLRAIDRCANDFAYLNEQSAGPGAGQFRHGGASCRPDGGRLRSGRRRAGRNSRRCGRAAERAGLPGRNVFRRNSRLFTVLPVKTKLVLSPPPSFLRRTFA